ncbi:hypothetical protein B0T20DRAFT_502031 [Sordaria brevicollis]|uniref:Uncharacterized protein n=1 Tax=Sordaria brevicollis TaxID=83679 RepID=A0AAE0UAN3_SORBR|nr:hypothetical protein B0T20DRAFT_502031 [Sordaria brevicollis]
MAVIADDAHLAADRRRSRVISGHRVQYRSQRDFNSRLKPFSDLLGIPAMVPAKSFYAARTFQDLIDDLKPEYQAPLWLGAPSAACDEIVDLTEEDQERLFGVNESDLIGGNLISRPIAFRRLRNELRDPAEKYEGDAAALYEDAKEALARLYEQVEHARRTYTRKVTYSELPMVKGIRNQAVKTISIWKEYGAYSDWKSHLPSRANLLACRIAIGECLQQPARTGDWLSFPPGHGTPCDRFHRPRFAA